MRDWRAIVLALSLAPAAQALILGGAVDALVSAPSDDPGWAQVGRVNGSTGVHVGNRWILTAAHVGAGATELNGIVHAVQPGSAVQLRRPDGSAFTDLVLFRLATDPGLPAVTLPTSTPPANAQVVLIGYGRWRGPAVTYTSAWVEGGSPVAFSGWKWGASGGKGHGFNRIAGAVRIDQPYPYQVETLVTDFSSGSGAVTNEAQGAVNDSGGGLFHKSGSTWRLAGIMLAIAGFEQQPAQTALFGNATYSADLSFYRSQIEAVRALATPFDIWAYDRFRGGPEAGPSEDPDGDGLANVQEFAFGLDPQVRDAAAGPQVRLADTAGGPALEIVFVRNTAATDVSVQVEVSGDLVSWSAGDDFTEVVAVEPAGENRERLTVRDRTPVATRRFIRVRVTR